MTRRNFHQRNLFAGTLVALAMAGTITGIGSITGASSPPSTDPHGSAVADDVPPIGVELLTPHSEFTDDLSGQFEVTRPASDPASFELGDPSRTVVARITLQPGAQFPWHFHPGPVVVNVTEGAFTYVSADDCVEHPYPASTAFVEQAENVHMGYNSAADGPTVVIATFFGIAPDGPLSITEGVEIPAECDPGPPGVPGMMSH